MTIRTSVLCLTITIMSSQSIYSQPPIRLGAGGSYVVTDKSLSSNDYVLGYNVMVSAELSLSPVSSILFEGVTISNNIDDSSGYISVEQMNIGIKLTSPTLYAIGLIGYNKATVTADLGLFGGISLTKEDIGGGGGVGLDVGHTFSEIRLYHSKALDTTYLLGIVGYRFGAKE